MDQKISITEALYKRQSTRAFDMNGLSAEELKQITDYADTVQPLIPGKQTKAEIVGSDDVKAIMKWRAPHYFVIYSDGTDEGMGIALGNLKIANPSMIFMPESDKLVKDGYTLMGKIRFE